MKLQCENDVVLGFEINGKKHDFITAVIEKGSNHNNEVVWHFPNGQMKTAKLIFA